MHSLHTDSRAGRRHRMQASHVLPPESHIKWCMKKQSPELTGRSGGVGLAEVTEVPGNALQTSRRLSEGAAEWGAWTFPSTPR